MTAGDRALVTVLFMGMTIVLGGIQIWEGEKDRAAIVDASPSFPSSMDVTVTNSNPIPVEIHARP